MVRSSKAIPAASRVREVFLYEPRTGLLLKRAASASSGRVAGHVSNRGYLVVQFDGYRTTAQRVIVAYMTGHWPTDDVDHIDGDRVNNKWLNLRVVTRSENNQNVISARCDSTHGLRGVSRTNGVFFARIAVGGQVHYLGTFPTALDAHLAYIDAKRVLHPAAVRGMPNAGGAVSSHGSPKQLYGRGAKA